MMSRGYYIRFKDFTRYSKYENNSEAKIERKNYQKRLTPLQKMMFCRPIYYDTIFSGNSNITDYRPFLAQQKNPDKNKNITKHFESVNPVKLMGMVFAPVFRKVQYTEYTLKANFKNICELRTYESFSMRSLRTKDDLDKLINAEFVYYWSQNIVLNYNITEIYLDNVHNGSKEKCLNISVSVTSTEDILKKFNEDRVISIKYVAELKKKKKHAPISYYHSTYERISRFVKEVFASDRMIEKFKLLLSALLREEFLQKYFYDSDLTFMKCIKNNDHLTRMNKFKWENEDYSYIKKIEEIPESRKANAQVQEKYLYDVTNFKTRHRKLLRKISKRLDV